MLIQDVVQECVSFGDVDGSNLLRLIIIVNLIQKLFLLKT